MDAEVNASDRFTLLASAVSGRPLEVAAGDPGMPAWTDGRTVFIDAEAAHQTQVQCVVGAGVPPLRGEPRTSSSRQVGPEALRNFAAT